MSRISKQSVHEAVDHMRSLLNKAAGPDKIVSEADAKKVIKTLDGVEKDATKAFHKFAATRATSAEGSRLSTSELDRAAEYVKKELIDDYDQNGNGLSKSEVGKMSKTGMLAVRLAQSRSNG